MNSFKLKKWTSWIVTVLMIFTILAPSAGIKVKAADANVTLQILATSDLHGRFAPYDYALNQPDATGSMEQIASAVKVLKAQNPNTVLVDAGDTIQDNSAEIFFKDDMHPLIAGFNAMSYDAITLGNHEFNYGVPILQHVMAQAKPAILCGNVYDSKGTLFYKPYTIVEKGGVKVGIIGMTTPNITKWDATNLETCKVTNPIEETKKAIAEIKDKVDVIIAVEHMSETSEYGVYGSGAEDVMKECPEITAFIGAHGHTIVGTKAKQTSYSGIKMVENKNSGATLAQVNIKLTQKDGKYVVNDKLADVNTDVINMYDSVNKKPIYTPDADLASLLQKYDNEAKLDAEQPIGTLTGGDLVPANEINGIPTAQIQETSMIDLINDVQKYYAKADISSAAAFSAVANIKQGTIRKCDMSLIYKYANTLYSLKMTGKQLKQYLEWSAQFYNTYNPGDLTLSFNSKIPGYNYDMISGIKYQVDVSQPFGKRIVNLTKVDGKTKINDTETFIIAVNNYRANTQLTSFASVDAKTGVQSGPYLKEKGDTLPTIVEKDIMGGTPVRELIGKYIKDVKGGNITNTVRNEWSITGTAWDKDLRAQAVNFINSGKITLGDYNPTPVTTIDIANKTEAAKKIDVVSFNDFHGSLTEDSKNPGIAKLASAINSYKAANPNTILVSGGDMYQGSAMSNLTYGAPINEALKSMGLLASAIGNHEYDWGINRVNQWAKDGGFTFLASNIYDTTTGKPVTYAKPYLVTTVDGVKIGFVGLSTPETLFKTTAANVKNVEFRDPATAASEWAGKLKDGSLPEGKVDVVIALTHLGSAQTVNTGVITGEIQDLCNKATNIDAVVSAHTHNPIVGKVNGVPVIQAYCNGRDLAKLSICLDSNGKVTTIVPSLDNVYLRKASITPDASVKAIVDKYNTELSPILDKVVGHTDIDLTHDKSQVTSVLGNWACELIRKQAGTQVFINNGGGFRAPIPKGDITMGTLYTVFPFDNAIVSMKLKGSDLKRVLENGIGNTVVGNVQQSGLKITYDLNRSFMDRITSITLNDGTPIDMNAYYAVSTNDFMYNIDNPAKGGDNYDFTGAKDVVNTGIQLRDAIVMQLAAEAKPAPIPNDENVVPAIINAPVGSTTIVDTSKNPVVSKDVFNAVKGQDKNVTFKSNGVTWTFNGKDITSTITGNIDLSLKTVSDALKAKEVAKIKTLLGKNVPMFAFSFNYEGKLPGKATVKVFVGTEWANKDVTIFRYYSDKNSYEKITTVLVDKDGYLTYTTDHCSDYFITETSNVAKLPQTGSPIDTTVVVDFGLFMLAAGAAFVYANKKKEEERA